jgi:hypothetical protein
MLIGENLTDPWTLNQIAQLVVQWLIDSPDHHVFNTERNRQEQIDTVNNGLIDFVASHQFKIIIAQYAWQIPNRIICIDTIGVVN